MPAGARFLAGVDLIVLVPRVGNEAPTLVNAGSGSRVCWEPHTITVCLCFRSPVIICNNEQFGINV